MRQFNAAVAEKGRALLAQLTQLMSGYAVPKYVKEEAGKPSKKRML
jgi:L-lysine 2,3-aminomutase